MFSTLNSRLARAGMAVLILLAGPIAAILILAGIALAILEEQMSSVRDFLKREWLSLIVLALLMGGVLYLMPSRHPEPSPVVTVAPPAREIVGEIKRDVPVKAVKAYSPKAKFKLPVPDSVKSDDRQQVIAASEIRDAERPVTVTTVLNTETGDAETYQAVKPAPWFTTDQQTEIGLFAGYNDHGQAFRVEGRHGLLTVRGARLGLVGSAETVQTGAPRYFVGAGVWYRW